VTTDGAAGAPGAAMVEASTATIDAMRCSVRVTDRLRPSIRGYTPLDEPIAIAVGAVASGLWVPHALARSSAATPREWQNDERTTFRPPSVARNVSSAC